MEPWGTALHTGRGAASTPILILTATATATATSTPPTNQPKPPTTTGVVPPYSRPLPPGHAAGPPEADWRWAVGATPFGPYSNYSGVSDALRGAARRNLLLASLAAALREAQASLDGLDAFVAAHFLGPWAAAGLEGDAREGRRHFLDTVASTRHGFATGVTEGAVAALEGAMGALTGHLQAVAADLYAVRRDMRCVMMLLLLLCVCCGDVM